MAEYHIGPAHCHGRPFLERVQNRSDPQRTWDYLKLMEDTRGRAMRMCQADVRLQDDAVRAGAFLAHLPPPSVVAHATVRALALTPTAYKSMSYEHVEAR